LAKDTKGGSGCDQASAASSSLPTDCAFAKTIAVFAKIIALWPIPLCRRVPPENETVIMKDYA
jgi:hypothetical protein